MQDNTTERQGRVFHGIEAAARRRFAGFTIREVTDEEYARGCEGGGVATCTPDDGRRPALVAIDAHGRTEVACTAHATWDAGARIAAMGLSAGLDRALPPTCGNCDRGSEKSTHTQADHALNLRGVRTGPCSVSGCDCLGWTPRGSGVAG